MAQTDVLIDLGYADEFSPDDADWPNRPHDRWRTTVVALLFVAIAVLVADAVPPRLELLLTASVPPGSSFDLTDDGLYALAGNPPTRVTAYGLPSGSRRWELDSEAGAITVNEVGGVVLVMGQYCSQASAFQTAALDARSGATVWKRPGVGIFTVAGGRAVVLKRPPAAGSCDRMGPWLDPADAGLPVVWDAVDVASGALLWSLPVAAGVVVRAAYNEQGEAQWLVELRLGGEVTTRDASTGQVLGVGKLPDVSGQRPGSSFSVQPLSALGELVVATSTSPGGTLQVGAFARDTLAPRWLATVAPSGPPSTRSGYRAMACGPSICLQNGTRLVVLDSQTGTVRWQSAGAYFAPSDTQGLMGPPGGVLSNTISSGRGGASGTAASGGAGGSGGTAAEPHYELIDTATGQSRLNLGGWQARVRSHQPSQVVLSMYATGRTWFERLDTGTARVMVLGSASGRYSECSANARYLACATVTGTIRVWRLAPS